MANCAARSPGGECFPVSASIIRVFVVVACVLEHGGPCWGVKGGKFDPGGTLVKESPGGGVDCGFPNIKLPPGFSLGDLEDNTDQADDHYWDPWIWRGALEPPVISMIFGLVKVPVPNILTFLVLPDLIWMVNMVRPGQDWDFKAENQFSDPGLEDFGNWHFGVIVAAMGIPLEVALCGPGGVQIIQRLGDELRIALEELGLVEDRDSGSRPLGPACGDAWHDSLMIKEGWDWYQRCKGHLPRAA